MFTSETINVLSFFYPVGNTPAVSVTQSLPAQDPASILLLGCGDVRNVLFTSHLDDRQLDFTCCDIQKGIIARNILLLTMIIDDVDGKNDNSLWNVYYHMYLDKKSDDLLQSQAKKLVSLSTTMDTWQQSTYGPQLKFCDAATLVDARKMWEFYSIGRMGEGMSAVEKRLKAAVDTANKMKDERGIGVVITGFRSAAPAHVRALIEIDALHKHFWKHGTTNLDNQLSAKAKHPNPMFLTLHDGSTLHYGTDPFLGFHLASAYTPLEPRSPLYLAENGASQMQKVVDTARLEFRQWASSFRQHAGKITLRFFIGDAVAFAHTLQYARASGSSTAYFYRERYQLQPLVLLKNDYSSSGSAPVTFDVIDTSNLCDHVGPLNLLTAASPLLRNKMASTLYTEVLPSTGDSREPILSKMLCGDVPTVSALLGLFPVEYWTNTSCVSHGDEELLRDIVDSRSTTPGASKKPEFGTGQMFLRVGWKRPPCPAPPSTEGDLRLDPVEFVEKDLAKVLYNIYVQIFQGEDWTKMLAGFGLTAGQNPQPQYHRASLAAFLRLVKSRVACDWDKTMELFIGLVQSRPNAPMGANYVYIQELFAYLHLLDVYTVDVFKHMSVFGAMGSSVARGSGDNSLSAWKNIPPVVCVTMRVPRKQVAVFTDMDARKCGTPAVHCKLSSDSWENIFPACQFSFGKISTSGTRHSETFKVCINEDPDGWCGNSALFVTFHTPSWFLLRDYTSAVVSFGLYSTPQIVSLFMKHFGLTLDIYKTMLSNSEEVYITKHAPNLEGSLKALGFTSDQMTTSDHSSQAATTSVVTKVDAFGKLATMTGRLDITSETYKSVLRDGCQVTVCAPTPCHTTVTLGQQLPLDLFFPTPVLISNQKTRIARKSSYIEVIAQLATVSSSAEFPSSFMYPNFLTGTKKVPLAWNMSHIDLQKQPILNMRQVGKFDWLNTHFSMTMSSRERAMRNNVNLPRSPGENLRVEFKDGLFSLFVKFAGLQGNKHSVFGVSNPGNGGVHMLIFPNKLRIDLATRTVVLDCAILPLHKAIMPNIQGFLQSLFKVKGGVCQIRVDDKELSLWKQVLPAWVERCRTSWSHGNGCEYRTAGKVPLTDQNDKTPFLCSCGNGLFPNDFKLADVPKWQSMAKKHSVRAAISPVFWAPFADGVYQPPMPVAGEEKARGCQVCGLKQKRDGKLLMKCARCRQVEYCSVECQKKDWKTHKESCRYGYHLHLPTRQGSENGTGTQAGSSVDPDRKSPGM